MIPCHLMRLVKSGRTVRITESLLAEVDCMELYVGLESVTQWSRVEVSYNLVFGVQC